MANSKYEYVKDYERHDGLLPSTYVVIRIDGRGFHRLSNVYNFHKPNDERALNLMNEAAKAVMMELPDVRIAYGISDEYSFAFSAECSLFERRESKLITTVVSTFTAFYVHLWSNYFSTQPLAAPLPTFDARAVLYPNTNILKDYFRWRQVDCHINNLYNTAFWTLVQRGNLSTRQAEERLKGTVAADKNEILFSEFGINYNNENAMFKKGSILYRQGQTETPMSADDTAASQNKKSRKQKQPRETQRIMLEHVDLIKEEFWDDRPWLLH